MNRAEITKAMNEKTGTEYIAKVLEAADKDQRPIMIMLMNAYADGLAGRQNMQAIGK